VKTVNVPVPPDTQRLLDAKSNAILTALISATPAQVDTWLTANVTNLAQARDVLKALALGLRYVYLLETKQ
jgi:hypothetical protein